MLGDMINSYLQYAPEGKSIDVNDPKKVALEAYVAYMRRGISIDPGKH